MRLKKITHLMLALLLTVLAVYPGYAHAEAQNASASDTPEKKTIKVGLSADFAPYEFIMTVDGNSKIVGSDVMIAEQIASDMGAELQLENMPFDSLLPALQSGRIDMVISGMTPTDERRQNVDFSDLYYVSRQVILTRAGDVDKYKTMDELAGKPIGVQTGSIQEEIANGIPDAQVTAVKSISDVVSLLLSDRVDAAVFEGPVAESQVKNRAGLGIAEAVPEDSDTPMAIAVEKGNTGLLTQINSTLERLNSENAVDEYIRQANEMNTGETAPGNIFSFFWKYRGFYGDGVKYTLLLSALGVLFGFLIGLLIALLRLSGVKILKWIAVVYTEVLRGTPMLVQLLIIHFGFATAFDIKFTVLQSGIITLSINSSAYLAEIFRAGIQGVDKGQMEAARSLGMPYGMAMRTIVIPQAIKSVLPAIGNEFVVIIKESSIVSFIGVADLMFQANAVRTLTYSGLYPLVIAAAIYLVMTLILSKLLNVFERRLSAGDNR
ncbi:ABC transporter substrate-binding protein/permease [Saccharibacillus sp. CPCC 101409]|uniref:ABC transporter substrate-binding protein/permease n=1 Tax=Saccharibacillus sp. CPCC 101409 TaxID=3058041 RepID=UPI0026710CD7|nr:ABC transporter substrate-binding protein/permease [Saccharibacillus sp. CPCC 101409]MDO3412156.1 ABC transporter substrate-binding protein/permease [Saccharibacillus sp. CPCC 101409]